MGHPDFCAALVPHQLAGEVGVGEGPGVGLLGQVGAGAVAAFDDLVVEEGLVELLHLGGELAGVLRADAVVLGGGEDEAARDTSRRA